MFHMTKVKNVLSLALLVVVTPCFIVGCGNKQSSAVVAAPTPLPKLDNAQQKFVSDVRNMTPKQQAEFFRKNPEMMRNPAVMNKLRQEMPKVMVKQTPGRRPQLNTGRPNF